MLAVNGNFSGYCVHLPVCHLQTVKSSKKVSRLRQALVSPNNHFPCQDAACPQSLEWESMRTGGHPDRWADIQSAQLHSGNYFCKALVSLKCHFPSPQSLEFESTSDKDRGLSWPHVNPVCPLTLPHTHCTHSSCLAGILCWKDG